MPQLFVRGLGGRTHALDLDPAAATLADLAAAVAAREGLPPAAQRLLCGSRQLADDAAADYNTTTTLAALGVAPGATLRLAARLRGGKGGFGANLRAAGKRAADGNVDACRDLQGRRVRHATAAAALEKWNAEAPERELEKVAAAAIRERARAERAAAVKEVDVSAIRGEKAAALAGVRGAVADAVAAGLARGGVPPRRAAALGAGLGGGSSDSGSGSEGESEDEAGGSGGGAAPAAERAAQPAAKRAAEPAAEPAAAPPAPAAAPPAPEPAPEPAPAPAAAPAPPPEPVDLAAYPSAAALEALGLDRLKAELTACGLKCGGTLAQRAERLFLLRGAALEELDARHRAAPPPAR
jgi:hypothetical protein